MRKPLMTGPRASTKVCSTLSSKYLWKLLKPTAGMNLAFIPLDCTILTSSSCFSSRRSRSDREPEPTSSLLGRLKANVAKLVPRCVPRRFAHLFADSLGKVMQNLSSLLRMRIVRSDFGSISRHFSKMGRDATCASLASSTQRMIFCFSFMKDMTMRSIFSGIGLPCTRSRVPGKSTICISKQLADSKRTYIGSTVTSSPSSSWASTTSCITIWALCSSHWLVLRFFTDHRGSWQEGLFRHSKTVGLRLPEMSEVKVNVSPARASKSRLLPHPCLPTMMKRGLGKSTAPAPSLSLTRDLISPSTPTSSLRSVAAVAIITSILLW
mmetsp:Transcript_57603/g.100797  ORF Transcript_57603/g.100797 Transcript_57603/m.100797 type:complete len:324 (+) Transcript_57603:1396-2367(+)